MKRKLGEVDGGTTAVRLNFMEPTKLRFSDPLQRQTLPATALINMNTDSQRIKQQNRAIPSQALRTKRNFASNASIILIGVRGCGKTTLALMASTALRRQLIDADHQFKHVTGLTKGSFIKEHGVASLRAKEVEILRSILSENSSGCVIACGSGCVEDNGQDIIRDYAKTHPVIHVVRDLKSVIKYLRIDAEKVAGLLQKREPVYRSCSNLEFYNHSDVSEGHFADEEAALQERVLTRKVLVAPTLTLKQTELDFLKFISLTLGLTSYQSTRDAPLILSSLPPEKRDYTYALSIPLSICSTHTFDIDNADAIELKIDLHDINQRIKAGQSIHELISRNFAILRRRLGVPMIYNVDPGSELLKENEGLYAELVDHGLRLGTEYITVELDCTDETIKNIMQYKGTTKVMGTHYEKAAPPGSWSSSSHMERYVRAAKLGCDIVRLAQPADTTEDNWAVARFRHNAPKHVDPPPPLIAFNTGWNGRTSRCFNPILTPVTHPSVRDLVNDDTMPITAAEAQTALHAAFISDKLRFYIFGGNVTYSLSPAMHNAANNACGMPHEWTFHEAKSLRELGGLVSDPHFGGCAVSQPYKTEVMSLLHSMSNQAKAIGAVNTIIPIREGEDSYTWDQIPIRKGRAGRVIALHGDNTDWIGIRSGILRHLSPANTVTSRTTGLVIGAGGMARAGVYAMLNLGVQHVFVFNRTLGNAENLARHFNRQSHSPKSDDSGASDVPPWSRSNSPAREGERNERVQVIKSLDDSWPEDMSQPSIVVCCIPAHDVGTGPPANFQMPLKWLESPTGGVMIEVRTKLGFFCPILTS
jgi:3-dehydroquinate dehydratase type I